MKVSTGSGKCGPIMISLNITDILKPIPILDHITTVVYIQNANYDVLSDSLYSLVVYGVLYGLINARKCMGIV